MGRAPARAGIGFSACVDSPLAAASMQRNIGMPLRNARTACCRRCGCMRKPALGEGAYIRIQSFSWRRSSCTTVDEMLSDSAKVAALLAAVGLAAGPARRRPRATTRRRSMPRTMADAVKALGAAAPVESKDVTLTAPDIAENGAVVPVGACDHAARRQAPAAAGGEEPDALAAMFELTDAVEPNIATRVKMGQSSQRLRRGDDGRRQGAVRAEGSQGHLGRVRRLNGHTVNGAPV